MRAISGVLGLFSLTATFYGQAFIHQKLGENFTQIGTGILSGSGLPFWSAEVTTGNLDVFKITGNTNFTASLLGTSRIANPIAHHPTAGLMWEGSGSALGSGNTDVFVETANISASVLGGSRDAFGIGFTSTGQPVWYGAGTANGDQLDIFRGSMNLTATVLGNNRLAVPAALNSNDQLLWDGSGSNLGANRDVFRTNLSTNATTNLSQSVLGNNRFAIAVALNANNDAVWYGSGSSNSDYNDVFFNSTNVSFPIIGGGNITNPRDAVAVDVSGNNLTWSGRSATTSQFYDSFASTIGGGTVNMSQSALGNGRDSYPIDVEGASVLWNGIGANTNNYDVFVTRPSVTRNLSQLKLGGGNTVGVREGYGIAVFASGNAFWVGKHSTTNDKFHLFHYNWTSNASANLVQEAVGSRDAEAIYLAHNGAEQVLWAIPDSAGTRYEVYLSTPNIATNLQGTVTIAGFAGDTSQIALTIRQYDPYTGNIVATHTGNMNSGFTYSIAVTPGLYDGLRITAPRCLARNIPGLRRLLGATTLDFSLTLGDVNGDNVIDDADLLEVLFNFGSNSTNPVDLNGDGVVDDADLLIVLFNFGSQGD
ncbi:MAG: hypothetical protein KatS3mg017_0304 [Fimbriimonadales bacterium]|nr:MAG: hypothetical protein KatS3mg017_0304 [Fimbriimonadales bacterium]